MHKSKCVSVCVCVCVSVVNSVKLTRPRLRLRLALNRAFRGCCASMDAAMSEEWHLYGAVAFSWTYRHVWHLYFLIHLPFSCRKDGKRGKNKADLVLLFIKTRASDFCVPLSLKLVHERKTLLLQSGSFRVLFMPKINYYLLKLLWRNKNSPKWVTSCHPVRS